MVCVAVGAAARPDRPLRLRAVAPGPLVVAARRLRHAGAGPRPLAATGRGPVPGVPDGAPLHGAVVLGVANIPAMATRLGPADSAESMPAVRELVSGSPRVRAWGARRPAGTAVRRAVQRPRHARARAARCPLVRGRPGAVAPGGGSPTRAMPRSGSSSEAAQPERHRPVPTGSLCGSPGDKAVAVFVEPLDEG